MAEETNIWMAAGDGLLDKVQGFVASGVSANAQDEHGYSPLHAASSYGNKEVIQWLLANGANVNIKDEDGDSPLSVCEEPVCAQVLLDAGADLAAANNEGHCAIQVAHIDYRDEMVEFYRSVYASRSVPVPELPERDGDDDDDDEENEGDMSDEDEDE